jgi:hypothetical protein
VFNRHPTIRARQHFPRRGRRLSIQKFKNSKLFDQILGYKYRGNDLKSLLTIFAIRFKHSNPEQFPNIGVWVS